MSSFIVNITNTSSETGTVVPDVGFKYTDRLNGINEATIKFSGIGQIRKGLLEVGSIVEIKKDGTRDFYGLVNDINYLAGGAVVANVMGFEGWLALENGAYAGSPWTATASATIASAIIGESSEFTAGTIEAGSNIDFRLVTTDSLYNALSNLVRKTQQDLGIDYVNLEVDVLDHKGSSTSVATLNSGIEISNVRSNQIYPRGNIIRVIGSSEGETEIVGFAEDATSKSTYGNLTLEIRDRSISTTAEANLLAVAELAINKDPIEIYDFDVNTFSLSIVSGDVITLNARSQEINAKDVRVVGVERGIIGSQELMVIQVANESYAKSVKRRNEIMGEIDRNARQGEAYNQYSSEYSNQNINTNIAGNITFYLTTDIIPALTADFNGFSLRGIPALRGEGSGAADFIDIDSSLDMRNSQRIINLITPTVDGEVASKGYVDGAIGKVWAASGTDFIPLDVGSEHASYSVTTGNVNADTFLGTAFVCPVHLPDGVTITGVVVYGNSTSENWALRKGTHQSATVSSIATATIETEDNSISGNPVDNSTNYYFLVTDIMDQNDKIEGARITYTI